MKKGSKHTKESLIKIGLSGIGRVPWNKGKHWSEDVRKKLSESHKGLPGNRKGQVVSDETRKKQSLARIGVIPWNKGKKLPQYSGKNHWNWKLNRDELKTDRNHQYDSKYKDWMKRVKTRDGWKCKINNKDCSGRIEAHHILSWSEHPELRYEINNGISLCHFHHPRKKIDEKKLVSTFQALISTIV